jgi:DNA-directed RNA polymerase alpha subunit
VQIHNPDMYITSLDEGFEFTAQIRIEKNVGYTSIEDL